MFQLYPPTSRNFRLLLYSRLYDSKRVSPLASSRALFSMWPSYKIYARNTEEGRHSLNEFWPVSIGPRFILPKLPGGVWISTISFVWDLSSLFFALIPYGFPYSSTTSSLLIFLLAGSVLQTFCLCTALGLVRPIFPLLPQWAAFSACFDDVLVVL